MISDSKRNFSFFYLTHDFFFFLLALGFVISPILVGIGAKLNDMLYLVNNITKFESRCVLVNAEVKQGWFIIVLV